MKKNKKNTTIGSVPEPSPNSIRRRRFLKVGAAAGVAAATGGSCAGLGSILGTEEAAPSSSLTAAQMDAYIARLDRGMKEISKQSFMEGIVSSKSAGSPEMKARAKETDALVKKALHTLLFTGMYNDLPEENRTHPGMQARLDKAMPEMDEAVFGMTGKLAALSPAERSELQRALRQQPDAGLKISEALDDYAKKIGVPLKRRLQLRSMLTNLSWRMRAQSPSLLIDSYVEKVQKVAVRNGQSEELKRYLATAVSTELLWRQQKPATHAAVNPRDVRVDPPKGPELPHKKKKRPPLQSEKKKKRGGGAITAGGVLMGIGGAALLAGGIILATAGIAGAFVMTAGGVILVVGLIVLIVGLVLRARS